MLSWLWQYCETNSIKTFPPPPDDDLPVDWRAVPGTVVPSARAINKLLDYWRDKANEQEHAAP